MLGKSSLKKRTQISKEQALFFALHKLSKLNCSQIFLLPVNTEVYSDYPTLVPNPMNFTQVLTKLRQSKYNQVSDVYSDLMLICKNCFTYHQGREGESKMKEKVAKFIKSIDCAWNLLRKDLGESMDHPLLKGQALSTEIQTADQKIDSQMKKKLEKLTNNFVEPIGEKRRSLKQDKYEQQIQTKTQKVEEKIFIVIENTDSTHQKNSMINSKSDDQNGMEKTHLDRSYHDNYKQQFRKKESEQSEEINQTRSIHQNFEKCRLDNKLRSEQEQEESKCCDTVSLEPSLVEKSEKTANEQSERSESIRCLGESLKEECEVLRKNKLKKYKTLLLKNIIWIHNSIFQVQVRPHCDLHEGQLQSENPDQEEIKDQCYDCIEFQKELQMNIEFRNLKTFTYLESSLRKEKDCMEKGQINLKKLLKLLKEISLWIQLLSCPYINWRTQEQYCEVEKNLIKCTEKIIQYKNLGPDFVNVLEKAKQSNQDLEKTQDHHIIGVMTRRKRKSSNNKRHDYAKLLQNYQLEHRRKIKKVDLTNRHMIDELILEGKESPQGVNDLEHDNFLYLIEKDQIYTNFKVVIVRDEQNPQQLKIKNNLQPTCKKRRPLGTNQQGKQPKYREDFYQDMTEDQDFEPIKKKFKIQARKLTKNEEQDKIRQKQKQKREKEAQDDELFIQRYSLKSNALIIEKYKEKLELDWDKKWEQVFGRVDSIQFQSPLFAI